MTLDKEDIATAKEMAKTLQQSKNDELVVVGNLLSHLLAHPAVTESHKLMLEALIWADAKGENWEKVVSKAIRVAQEALSSPNGEAQPEQRNVSEHLEHVACVTYKEVADTMNGLWGGTIVQRQIAEELENTMLYTTPPQRTWVGLTDEEIHRASTQAGMQEHYMGFHSGFIRFAHAVEAKLMEKNT